MVQENLRGIWEGLKAQFPDLIFIESSHTYFIEGKKLPSVSTLLKNFYEPFDSETVGLRYALKRGFEEIDVHAAWDGENTIANDKGHMIHTFGEDYAKWKYFGIGEKPVCGCKQRLGIIEFWNQLPEYLIPVALELQMYSKKYGYCGTADILLYDLRTDTYVIADYKTNKKLRDENTKYPTAPLLNIPPGLGLVQDNYGKYTLQFSFYQILLEEAGLKISDRILIYLQENQEKTKLYQLYHTQDASMPLRAWLEKNL